MQIIAVEMLEGGSARFIEMADAGAYGAGIEPVAYNRHAAAVEAFEVWYKAVLLSFWVECEAEETVGH